MKIIVFISLFIFLIHTSPVYASSLGNIPYWESNAIKIGRWDNTPAVYLQGIGAGSFNQSDLEGYMNYARTQWSNAGIPTTSTSSPSSADINYYGGTWPQVNSFVFNLGPNDKGFAAWDEVYEGDWTYSTGPKQGYTITGADLYIVYISGKTDNYYRHIATHELGHGLGWFGHAPGNTNVMSTNHNNVITSLTTLDKRHLGQVY